MDVLPGFKHCSCPCHDGKQVFCGCFGPCCPFPRGSKRVKARCESCGVWVSEVAMANHAHTPWEPVTFKTFIFPQIANAVFPGSARAPVVGPNRAERRRSDR